MKKILIAVAALGVFLTASAYFIGSTVEGRLKENFDNLATSSPNLSCTLKQKHRGIFESSYTYTVDFTGPVAQGSDATPVRISMDATYRVAHGPIPFAAMSFAPCLALADTTFTINPETDADIREVFEKLPELLQTTLHTRYGFDMGTSTDINMPPVAKSLAFADKPSLKLSWQGLSATVNVNSELSAYNMTFSAPGLAIQDPAASVSFSGMSGGAEGKRIQGFVWSGNFHHLLQTLDVKPAAPGKPFAAHDLKLNLSLTPNGPVLDYALAVSGTGKLPGGSTIPASLGMTFHSLDLAALNDLETVLHTKSPTPKAQPVSPEDFQRVATAMLKRSPWLEIRLSLMEGGEGPVQAQANLKTDQMKTLPDNILLALTQLRAQAKLDAPEKTVLDLACLVMKEMGNAQPEAQCRAGITGQLDEFVSRGYLVRNGGQLTSEAVWNGLAVLLNGKPMQ